LSQSRAESGCVAVVVLDEDEVVGLVEDDPVWFWRDVSPSSESVSRFWFINPLMMFPMTLTQFHKLPRSIVNLNILGFSFLKNRANSVSEVIFKVHGACMGMILRAMSCEESNNMANFDWLVLVKIHRCDGCVSGGESVVAEEESSWEVFERPAALRVV